ncbi:MAG: vWA domain-containing protein [Acidobacteriota bacterium]
MFRLLVTLSLALLLLPVPSAAASDLLLVLDASGSMWGQIEGKNKIVIAREVIKELSGGLADDAEVGLIAYGHRREGDCEDVETVMPIATLDRAALGSTVDGLNPKGKTPITRSLEQAFEVAKARTTPTTVILVSDGLETCGGDPCAAVRAAKEAGVDFLMHVIGFDVGKENVAQLECAAQAGGGLYRSADNAAELSGALEQAVAMPADDPPGMLSVKVIADGELQDATVRVRQAADDIEVASSRTYTADDTNPRVLPLSDGTYHVLVRAVGVRGEVQREFKDVVIAGEPKEILVDFSTGELVIGANRNDALGDATVRVYYAGTNTEAAANRTYTSASSNPKTIRLTAGTYDIVIKSVEIGGRPTRRIEGVVVDPGGRVENIVSFESGTLTIGAVQGDERVDAVVRIVDAEGNQVGQSRTYTGEKTNPKTFTVEPGTYTVRVKGLGGIGEREIQMTVERGGSVEQTVDFAGGS